MYGGCDSKGRMCTWPRGDVCALTETQTFNARLAQAKKACSAATVNRLLAMT